MTERDRIIRALKAADITKDDWHWSIVESITDLYARGYIVAYREYACGWSIWGKS